MLSRDQMREYQRERRRRMSQKRLDDIDIRFRELDDRVVGLELLIRDGDRVIPECR